MCLETLLTAMLITTVVYHDKAMEGNLNVARNKALSST
jgi:hypothetical protein